MGNLGEKIKDFAHQTIFFVERKVGIPAHLRKNRYIYFINIAATATLLQEHYSLFKSYVKFDFDPLSVVFEAEDLDSPFWNAIWGGTEKSSQNICLIGLLFGYGIENSYPFSWHYKSGKTPEEAAFIQAFFAKKSPSESQRTVEQFHPPQSFPLPSYHSFSICDVQLEKYRCERDIIRKIYMNSNIIECTMRQLLN